MKPKTSELMKFKRLCRRLGESKRGVVGLLELLWIGTASNCPEGDVGRFSNEEIAIMCDWGGDADKLIDALVETKWIDRCSTYRLVVHDWHHHAPTYIRGNLKTHGRDFVKATCTEQPAIATCSDNGASFPILSLPSKSIDREERSTDAEGYENSRIDPATWEAALPDFQAASETLGAGKRLTKDNRDTVVRCILVARARLPAGFIADLLGTMGKAIRKEKIPNPFGYFKTSVVNACADRQVSYHRAAAALEIPEQLLHPPPQQPATA